MVCGTQSRPRHPDTRCMHGRRRRGQEHFEPFREVIVVAAIIFSPFLHRAGRAEIYRYTFQLIPNPDPISMTGTNLTGKSTDCRPPPHPLTHLTRASWQPGQRNPPLHSHPADSLQLFKRTPSWCGFLKKLCNTTLMFLV